MAPLAKLPAHFPVGGRWILLVGLSRTMARLALDVYQLGRGPGVHESSGLGPVSGDVAGDAGDRVVALELLQRRHGVRMLRVAPDLEGFLVTALAGRGANEGRDGRGGRRVLGGLAPADLVDPV